MDDWLGRTLGNHRPCKLVRPASNIKLMSDRLVCMNGGNPRPALIDKKTP
jgi:hypothetical protein